MYKNIIFLDMDGVLADFDRYCLETIGKSLSTFPDSESGWAALGQDKYTMFRHLKPMEDAHILVDGVIKLAHEYRYHVGVLTAIPKIGRVPLAKRHKKEWLYNHFPELLDDFNIGPYAEDKQKHCVVGDILIDDSHLNIPQWIDVGGVGILHTSAINSLVELETHLRNK
jgi:5'(3')-deoxyribonucleotidase